MAGPSCQNDSIWFADFCEGPAATPLYSGAWTIISGTFLYDGAGTMRATSNYSRAKLHYQPAWTELPKNVFIAVEFELPGAGDTASIFVNYKDANNYLRLEVNRPNTTNVRIKMFRANGGTETKWGWSTSHYLHTSENWATWQTTLPSHWSDKIRVLFSQGEYWARFSLTTLDSYGAEQSLAGTTPVRIDDDSVVAIGTEILNSQVIFHQIKAGAHGAHLEYEYWAAGPGGYFGNRAPIGRNWGSNPLTEMASVRADGDPGAPWRTYLLGGQIYPIYFTVSNWVCQFEARIQPDMAWSRYWYEFIPWPEDPYGGPLDPFFNWPYGDYLKWWQSNAWAAGYQQWWAKSRWTSNLNGGQWQFSIDPKTPLHNCTLSMLGSGWFGYQNKLAVFERAWSGDLWSISNLRFNLTEIPYNQHVFPDIEFRNLYGHVDLTVESSPYDPR
jgi:hypothetical protein